MDRTAKTRQRGVKGFLYWWLESRYNPKIIYVDILLLFIISVSVFFTLLELYNQDKNLPVWIFQTDNAFTVLFVLEYAIRLYISTDFIADIKAGNFFYAIRNKCKWIFSLSALIDLAALLPIIRFIRFFKAGKFLRFIKVFRFLRILKVKKITVQVSILARSLKESYFSFLMLFTATLIVIFLNSVGLFLAETQVDSSTSLAENIIYTLKLIGLSDTTPKTIIGRIFASLTLFANIAFISVFISIISSKAGEIMDNIKMGKTGNLNIQDHIVLCGYTNSSKKVIEELLNNKRYCSKKIVLVTEKKNPNLNGIIYVNGDYSDIDVLRQVNVKDADLAVVFSEYKEHETIKNVDMRTVLTVYNVEQENPAVHTIAEIINEKNAEIIKEKIKGDEIIFKETIDAHLIVNCIRHQHISPLIYELLDSDNRIIKEKTLKDFGFNQKITFKELKQYQLDHDIIILGYINTQNAAFLAPQNSTVIDIEDRLIYVE